MRDFLNINLGEIMTDAEQQEVINKSINLLGLQGQVDQFHEEVGELLTAINC